MDRELFIARLAFISNDEIKKIDKNSSIAYLKALYHCENSIAINYNKEELFTHTTAINNLGYNDDFSKIFILDKENLNETYLNARKNLYYSFEDLKEERNQKIKNIQRSLNQDNLSKEEKEQIQKTAYSLFQVNNFYDETTNTIVFKTDNIKIIFLDKVSLKDLQSNTSNTSFISMSNLIHIYDNHCDIFTKDRSVLDIKAIEEKYQIDFKSLDTKIFLNSTLLIGANELPNNPLYFGELDEKRVIKQDLPSYYFSPSDESSSKGRLAIFYKNDELCLLNYSILENSLNIKLECLNKQSLEYKDLILNTLKEQESTQTDKKQSIATLHALLENQNVECIHGGKVILKSSKGKSFKDNNIPLMLESDLLNSSIVGCPNTLAGVSYPCTKVVSVKGSLSQKKVNGEFVILQELLSGSLTDKGVPLKVSFIPTKFKFDHSFELDKGVGGQSETITELKEPILRLYYKEHKYQEDNLLITNLKVNDKIYTDDLGIRQIELNDFLEVSNATLLNTLKQTFIKEYDFKEVKMRLGVHVLNLIFIIPKNIPKIYKEAYKSFEDKELGAGYFKQLHEYDEDYRENGEIIHNRIFLSPSKMQKINFEIARGLDEWLKNEDVCSFNIYTKNYFGIDNKDIVANNQDINSNHTNTIASDENFNETQETIPPNVIRIETQDGSGEFIEIEFDESVESIEKSIEDEDKMYDYLYDDSNLITDASDYVNQENRSDFTISRFIPRPNRNFRGGHKKPYGKIRRVPEYARNKRDVVRIIDELEVAKRSKGSNRRVRLVATRRELRKILQRLIKYAEQIDIKTENIFIRKIQQHKKMIITRYKLKDDTFIKHRTESQSGGETIEINKNEFIIHNKGQLFK